MNEHQQNIQANHLVTNLIEADRDNFDIEIAIELQDLAEQIKQKRRLQSFSFILTSIYNSIT